jgi:hypothetical protein
MNVDLSKYAYCFRYGIGSDSLPSQPLPDVHYNWVDVTEEFFDAVKGMIHSGDFNYHFMFVYMILYYFLFIG